MEGKLCHCNATVYYDCLSVWHGLRFAITQYVCRRYSPYDSKNARTYIKPLSRLTAECKDIRAAAQADGLWYKIGTRAQFATLHAYVHCKLYMSFTPSNHHCGSDGDTQSQWLDEKHMHPPANGNTFQWRFTW